MYIWHSLWAVEYDWPVVVICLLGIGLVCLVIATLESQYRCLSKRAEIEKKKSRDAT